MNSAPAVVLAVSVRKGNLYVDLAAGPILRYCPACQHVSAMPYPYSGSRYGQVGSFGCERCGTEVALVDRDCRPPIEYSVASRGVSPGGPTAVTIWHEDLYGVAPQDFLRIEEWTGLRFFEGVCSAALPFQEITGRLEAWVAEHGMAPLEPAGAPGYRGWMEVVFGDAARRHPGGLRPQQLPEPFVTAIPDPFRRWLALYCCAYAHRDARGG